MARKTMVRKIHEPETFWPFRQAFKEWADEAMSKIVFEKRAIGENVNKRQVLATMLGASEQTLNAWLSHNVERAPKPKHLKILGDFLMRDYRELLDKPDAFEPPTFTTISANTSHVSLPILSLRPTANVLGEFVEIDETPCGSMPFDRFWIYRSLGAAPEKLKLYNIDGNGLEPMFQMNDMILVNTAAWDAGFKAGVWLIRRGGGLMMKRVRALPSGGYEAYSDNPKHQSFALDDDCTFLGRVVWTGRLN
jgi:hypothetical protein